MKEKILISAISLLSFGSIPVLSIVNTEHRAVNINSTKELTNIHIEDIANINFKYNNMGIFDTLFKKKSQSEILKETLEKGSAEAQLNLGYKYETGEIGGTPNYEISMKLYLKAAEQGNDMAMNNIGWAYHQGLGVEPNQSKAKEWFEKAIEKGNLYAMSNLGIAYFNGMYAPEIPQDYQKALELLTIPANNGDVKSMYAMGIMGLYGIGGIEPTEQNLQIAQQFIKMAAEQGHPLAQELLDKCQGDLSRAKEITIVTNPYEGAINLFNEGRAEEAFNLLFPLIEKSDAEAYYIFGLFFNYIANNEFGYVISYKEEVKRFFIVILEERKDDNGNHFIKDAIALPIGFNESYTNSNDRIDIAFIKKAAALGSKDAQKSLEELENK